ncbi:hypothetical protein N0Y54_37245 [Nostoc punctiforme UO1]|uniref:hypothetical protein n=1 Tax=Nostoc punctiforme TaxID=272131 RepID=UPI0030A6C53F
MSLVYFKNLTNSEEMLRIVRDEALPFIKTLGVSTAEIEARDSLSEDHAGASEVYPDSGKSTSAALQI